MVRFKHRLARLALTALAATAATAQGCSDDDQGQEINPATASGEVRVELVDANFPAVIYRLRQTELRVTGSAQTTITVDQSELRHTLPVGSYTVELLPGWVLERQDGADYRAVSAELVSPNPASFDIVQGQTTTVTYRFRATEQSGGVIVRVGVGEEDDTCRAQASYGDLGALARRGGTAR